jgi:hypothetical protein
VFLDSVGVFLTEVVLEIEDLETLEEVDLEGMM